MSNNQTPTKEQLLRSIEQLERKPNDRGKILGEIGISAIGAVGIAGAVATLGTTTASIPLITALTGISMVVAAPVTLVAGAAVAGGAAMYGVSKLIQNGAFHEGKRAQLLEDLHQRIYDTEVKERRASVSENDITGFHLFLKEPLRLDLISAKDAHNLMQEVERGHISLSDAYKLVEALFSGERITSQREVQPTKPEMGITTCPKCSQKLRAPVNLGNLKLSCPKCKHSWSWSPLVKYSSETRLTRTSGAWCNTCNCRLGLGSCKTCRTATQKR
jgi:hypothetical protein